MTYGINDNSYKAAGQLAGIEQLVADFYQYMDSLPEAAVIRAMHQPDLTLSQKKLSYFYRVGLVALNYTASILVGLIFPKPIVIYP